MAQPANATGLLHITFHKGEDLRDTEITGKQDPYVKFWIQPGEKQKQRTSVHKKGGVSPVWEEKFALQIDGKDSTIDMECMNKELVIDETIGVMSVPIEKLLETDKPMWYSLAKGYGHILITAKFKGSWKGKDVNTIDPPATPAAPAAPAAPAGPAPAAPPAASPVQFTLPTVPVANQPPPAPVSVVAVHYEAPPPPKAVEQKAYQPAYSPNPALPPLQLHKKDWAIHNLYRATLHRKADDTGLQHHVAMLEGKTYTIYTLFWSFLNSEEFAITHQGKTAESLPERHFIGLAYEAMIGRCPISTEYSRHVAQLHEGKLRRYDVAHQIGTYAEFESRQQKGLLFKQFYTWYIKNLAKHVFNREADAELIGSYYRVLDNHETNVADVFKGFLDGPEYKAKGHGDWQTLPSKEFVTLVWRVMLNRDPVQGEIDIYATDLDQNKLTRYDLVEKVQLWDEFSNLVHALE